MENIIDYVLPGIIESDNGTTPKLQDIIGITAIPSDICL